MFAIISFPLFSLAQKAPSELPSAPKSMKLKITCIDGDKSTNKEKVKTKVVFAKKKKGVKQYEPLFFVNGHESTRDAVYSINPNQIKSMTVLKNTAAIEKYGHRAVNGVVLITTK